MKKFLAIAALVALAGCGVSPDKATRALNSMGVKNVEIGGYAFWGCGKDDGYASKFTGTGQDGNPVSGVVCSGMFKGVTIRFD